MGVNELSACISCARQLGVIEKRDSLKEGISKTGRRPLIFTVSCTQNMNFGGLSYEPNN